MINKMKLKSIVTFLIVLAMYSCGSKKTAVTKDAYVQNITNYISSIDRKQNLKVETTEGALTDAEGFKDIGTFKYTVHYDEKFNELFKIVNIEKTAQNITETYYFKDGDLVFLKSESGNTVQRLFLKNDKVILNDNISNETQSELIEKANRFYKMFKKNH